MPSPTSSDDTTLDHESSADFEATYAENRGGLVCTPIEEMLTTWPRLAFFIAGIRPMTSRIAPK